MSSKKTMPEVDSPDKAFSNARRAQLLREQTYRERALKIYPWICARCGRDFSGKNLRELTVHHKDHNHDNNPPNGSNWELLCLYCHDNEHSRYLEEIEYGCGVTPGSGQEPPSTYKAFAGLDGLLKGKK